MNVAVLRELIFEIRRKGLAPRKSPSGWVPIGMAPDNGWTQGLALTNFPKSRGGTFDKEVPHLLCTGTLQDEVQRTLALGGAKGKDDPIIVAACNVRDIIDVNDVVLKTNEVHWAASMTQYGQSEIRLICEKKRSLTHRQALCWSEAVFGHVTAAAGQGAPFDCRSRLCSASARQAGRQCALLLWFAA
jgi:hypothetical protein